MLSKGDKFRAPADSTGNIYRFWVDTLCFTINGSFVTGDIVEVQDYVIEDKRITLDVKRIDPEKLDVEITDVVFPVSAVGMDRETDIELHPNMVHILSDMKNHNKIFLILLRAPHNKRTKIRLSLGNSGNILEYVYDG